MSGRRHGQASADWILTRQAALAFVCPEPGCNRPPGELCRNVHTGRDLIDQPAHWRRIRASKTTEQETST